MLTAEPGPAFYLQAAVSFFRALRVYPSPVELMALYQSAMPEAVFKVCNQPRSQSQELMAS